MDREREERVLMGRCGAGRRWMMAEKEREGEGFEESLRKAWLAERSIDVFFAGFTL